MDLPPIDNNWRNLLMKQLLQDCLKRLTSLRERLHENDAMSQATTLFQSVTINMDTHVDISRGNVEDKGYFDSFGELLRRICTGKLARKSDASWYAYQVVGHEASESHAVEYVCAIQYWKTWFCKNFVNKLKTMMSWKQLGRFQAQCQKFRLIGNQSWKSEQNSGNDDQANIHWISELLASLGWSKGSWHNTSPHAEELTEEIDDAKISAIAFDWGSGTENIQNVCMNFFQRNSTESTSPTHTRKKDHDISRAYFQETMEKLI